MTIVVYNQKTRSLTKAIEKCLTGDTFGFRVPRLDSNNFIVAYMIDNQIASFIYCVISNNILTFSTGFTNIHYRRRGLSTQLRQWIISNHKQIDKFVSLPLPDSYSRALLVKMGFREEGNTLVLNKYRD